MDANPADHEIFAGWEVALNRAADAARIVVIGATDAGKSSFVMEVLSRRGRELALLDLDPGQKMIGPPGTVSLGRYDPDARCASPERFVFLSSTSARKFNATTQAASALAAEAGLFIVNTAGFIGGPGIWLQVQTIAALQPDLIVAIGGGLDRILAAHPAIPTVRIERSPLATRKSAARRAAIRQAAFASALDGALQLSFGDWLEMEPALPVPFDTEARPICALADERGDMAIGVLERFGSEIIVHAHQPPRTPRTLKLGSMWAEQRAGEWTLLERLIPSWAAPGG